MKFLANMSKRDRNLLVVLLVAVIFYLCYSFVITPALETAAIFKEELNMLNSETERVKSLMSRADDLEGEATLKQEDLIERYAAFFGDLDQAQLLYKADTLMQVAGIPVNSYTPMDSVTQIPLEKGVYIPGLYPLLDSARQIEPDLHVEAPSNQDPGGAEAEAEDSLPSSEITFGFGNASYESIFAFVKSVEDMNKATALKNLSIAKSEGTLSGQLTIAFYGVPALDKAHQAELEFYPVIPKGKGNPFQ